MKKLVLALTIFAMPASALAAEWIVQITALTGPETFYRLPGTFSTKGTCITARNQWRQSLGATITQNGVPVVASPAEKQSAAQTFKAACVRINY